jgi:acyl carrier protein
MTSEDRILAAIYDAIDEVNPMLEAEAKLEKSPSTLLADESSGLDSLGILNLVVATEASIERAFGREVMLSDDIASEDGATSFRSVQTLRDHIAGSLGDGND